MTADAVATRIAAAADIRNDGKQKHQSWEAAFDFYNVDCDGMYSLQLEAWGASEQEARENMKVTVRQLLAALERGRGNDSALLTARTVQADRRVRALARRAQRVSRLRAQASRPQRRADDDGRRQG